MLVESVASDGARFVSPEWLPMESLTGALLLNPGTGPVIVVLWA